MGLREKEEGLTLRDMEKLINIKGEEKGLTLRETCKRPVKKG